MKIGGCPFGSTRGRESMASSDKEGEDITPALFAAFTKRSPMMVELYRTAYFQGLKCIGRLWSLVTETAGRKIAAQKIEDSVEVCR